MTVLRVLTFVKVSVCDLEARGSLISSSRQPLLLKTVSVPLVLENVVYITIIMCLLYMQPVWSDRSVFHLTVPPA